MDDDLLGSCTGPGPHSGLLLLLAGGNAADLGHALSELLTQDGVALLVAGLLIIALSAFCSMTEAAFLSVSKLRAESLLESDNVTDRRIGKVRLDIAKPLAAIVILNNIANITGGAVFGAMVHTGLEKAGAGEVASMAGAILFTLLTLAVILYGEIVPKTVGETHPLRVARLTVYPISVLQRLLTPLIWLVGLAQKPFIRTGARHVTSEEELIRLTELGQEQGAIEKSEGEIIHRVFKLNDITVEDVMTPRVEMISLDAGLLLKDVAQELGGINRTRIPLVERSTGEIHRVLDRIDALLALAHDKDDLALTDRSISFKPNFVPEAMPVDKLLIKLQTNPEPLAIVVNEYGESMGLVTLEDVLEEIVGEIIDAGDLDEIDLIRIISEDVAVAQGRAEIKDLNEALGSEFPNHRTVAGLVLDELGRIPHRGEEFDAFGARFHISEVSDRAVLAVRVRLLAEHELEEALESESGEAPNSGT